MTTQNNNKFNSNNSRDDLDKALLSIPIAKVDNTYDDWLAISWAYKSAGGDYQVWDSWCSSGAKYNASENLRKWISFEDKTTPEEARRVVFYHAYQNGYTTTSSSYRNSDKALSYSKSAAAGSSKPADQVQQANITKPKEDTIEYPKLNNLHIVNIPLKLTTQESQVEAIKYLNALFEPTDNISIIFNVKYDKAKDKYNPLPDPSKANMTCQWYIDNIDKLYSNYNKEAGVWCRVNPMSRKGGKNEDVVAYKYALVESDDLPLQEQLNLMYALKLPIATLTYSGSKSIHAIVKIGAKDYDQYQERVKYLYGVCEANGLKVDQANKNPSRMSRLAGVLRGDKAQTLIATSTKDNYIGAKDFDSWKQWLETPEPEEVTDETVAEESKFKIVNASSFLESGSFNQNIDYFQHYKNRKTGFDNLDKHLTLYPGLMALGGGASVGKTTFAINLVDNLLKQGETILYFALEQEPIELITKQLAKNLKLRYGGSAISNLRIKNGETTPELEQVKKDYIKNYRNFQIVRGNFFNSSNDIKAYVEQYIRATSIKPVVVIDYLQLLSTPDNVRGDVREKLDYNVKQLKTMQVDNELLVIMISNLNRNSYNDPISYDSFKESGLIEYTCDYILGLQLAVLSDPDYMELSEKKKQDKKLMLKTAREQNPKKVQVVSLKNRNGKQVFSAYFDYYMAYDLFEPIANPYE